MRIISKSRSHFLGTHKGYTIEIDRIRPPVESFGQCHFYIRVFNDQGHAYELADRLNYPLSYRSNHDER